MYVCFALTVWVIKRLVVHFGVKNFAEQTLAAWWVVLERFISDRQDALLPGPIKGLAQFLLRVDTKVTSLVHPVKTAVFSYVKERCTKHSTYLDTYTMHRFSGDCGYYESFAACSLKRICSDS